MVTSPSLASANFDEEFRLLKRIGQGAHSSVYNVQTLEDASRQLCAKVIPIEDEELEIIVN